MISNPPGRLAGDFRGIFSGRLAEDFRGIFGRISRDAWRAFLYCIIQKMPIVLKHQKLSAFSIYIYNKVYYKLFSKSALPSLINLITNSPNSVFCHANHGRVNFDASSLWNDSWMNPMPASVFSSIFMQKRISSSLWAVKHFIMIDIGQGMSYPM